MRYALILTLTTILKISPAAADCNFIDRRRDDVLSHIQVAEKHMVRTGKNYADKIDKLYDSLRELERESIECAKTIPDDPRLLRVALSAQICFLQSHLESSKRGLKQVQRLPWPFSSDAPLWRKTIADDASSIREHRKTLGKMKMPPLSCSNQNIKLVTTCLAYQMIDVIKDSLPEVDCSSAEVAMLVELAANQGTNDWDSTP